MKREWTVLAAAFVAVAGCRSTGRLANYEFPGRTLAVAYVNSPGPRVLTGPYFLDRGHGHDPVHAVLKVGARVVKEIQAAEVRARLDSATHQVDVGGRMADRTLQRAARWLRARPVEREADADFIVEVRLRDYGIDAKDWDAAAHFFVDAEVSLIDGGRGTEVWHSHVRARDPIAPAIFGPGTIVRDVVTASALGSLEVDEIACALERLSDFAADRITDRLRDALARVR